MLVHFVVAVGFAEQVPIFVGLRELGLQDASFDRSTGEAEVTVRFVGELTSVVRNASGDIVEGGAELIRHRPTTRDELAKLAHCQR